MLPGRPAVSPDVLHTPSSMSYSGGMSEANRQRPRISLTLERDVYDALLRVKANVPGGTASGIVNELLREFLPSFEALTVQLRKARRPDGTFDEEQGRHVLEQWTGQQILRFAVESDKRTAPGKEHGKT